MRNTFDKFSIWGFNHALRMVKNNNPNYKNDSGICKGGEDGIGCNHCFYKGRCNHPYDHGFKLGILDMSYIKNDIKHTVEFGTKRSILNYVYVSFDETMGDKSSTKVYTYNQLLQYIECNPKSDRTIFFKTLPYVSELYNFYIGYKSYYKNCQKKIMKDTKIVIKEEVYGQNACINR